MVKIRVAVRLRWTDLDAYGHLNNVEFGRVLEEARIAVFWERPLTMSSQYEPFLALDQTGTCVPSHDLHPNIVAGGPGGDTATLIAQQTIDYLAPVPYQQSVAVDVWLETIGGASITVAYEIRPGETAMIQRETAGAIDELVYARARTIVVLADVANMRPRRVTAAELAAWRPLLGPAVPMRWTHGA